VKKTKNFSKIAKTQLKTFKEGKIMIACTFVHGYENNYNPGGDLPALLIVSNDVSYYNYEFPRNPLEFQETKLNIKGELPLESAKNFPVLPRFGFTGCAIDSERIYCGSWNGVYEIDTVNFECIAFITHRLMNDLHGICINKTKIYTILTGKDTVVVTSKEGEILNTYTINNKLEVNQNNPQLMEHDWRFISKQFRGSTGLFHFNYIQVIDGKIWLTSRNLGCFVVLDVETNTAELRTINQKTVVLLHDGVYKNNAFYFTSIDGKILISSESEAHNPREQFDEITYFNRDLNSKVIRLEETELGYQPNWCRGIDIKDQEITITIDGLYGSDLSFKLISLTENGELKRNNKIEWKKIGAEKNLRYVTGFDVKYL